MNPDLQDKLTSVLNFIGETVQQGKDFTLEQAPLLAKEMVAWEFWCATIIATILFLAAVTLLWTSIPTARWAHREDRRTNDPGRFTLPVFMWIFALVAGIACTVHAVKAVKCCVAPRLVLIEQVKKLVNL